MASWIGVFDQGCHIAVPPPATSPPSAFPKLRPNQTDVYVMWSSRYPTGLGALIVRERAARILRKGYFGGGTVAAALAGSPFRQLRTETERRLTDGTEHFLGILALEVGGGGGASEQQPGDTGKKMETCWRVHSMPGLSRALDTFSIVRLVS